MHSPTPDSRGIGARRWWALGALNLAVLAVGLDGTILSVALPTLAGALHASESSLQWFSSAYLLVLAAAMLPAAVIGDRYGRRRLMLGSLALFAVGSAGCAAATSAAWFIAARALLGFAGAGIIVMSLAAITTLFSQEERPKAIGVWAAVNFVAVPIGPILGGWLLTHYWWGWVFLINVPVALVGLAAGFALLPESRATARPGLDLTGIATSAAGLLALTYGLIAAGQHGWGNSIALASMFVGAGVLSCFFLWERRLVRRPGGQPLIDPGLFRSRSYTWGVILAAFGVLAMIGVLFTLPQYFQGVRGTDAMGSGLRLLPLIGGLVVGALPAERIARAVGSKIVVAAGFALIAAGLALGSSTRIGSTDAFVAAWMAVMGLGMGLAMATATSAALSELSEKEGGVGSAVLQALNKTGAPLGTAILGSVLSSTYIAHVDLAGVPAAAASLVRTSVFGGVAAARQLGSAALLASVRHSFVQGMDLALIVSAAIATVGIVLAVSFLPARTALQRSEQAASEQQVSLVQSG